MEEHHQVTWDISSAYNLKFNLNKTEFLTDVKSRNFKNSTLKQICVDLFTATQVAGLSDKRAQLITRRGTSLHPLSEKLIEDMWYFADCISSKKKVRRVMYKSGKRSAEYLQKKLRDNDVPVSSLPPVSTLTSLTSVPQQVIVNSQPTSEISSVPQTSYCQLSTH